MKPAAAVITQGGRKGGRKEGREGGREGGRAYHKRVAQLAQTGMEGTLAMKPAATVIT